MTTNFSTNPRAITAAPPAARGGRARGVLIALGALAVLAVGAGAWVRAHPRTAASPTAAAAARPDRKPRVAAVTVQAKPFPILLEGLGTVTPLATVTIKPQVEGQLLSLAFHEGGAVRRGQLLAEIDPRPFRIGVEQARATLARDAAQLRNAQLDLERYKTLQERKLVAQQQLDAQRALVDQLQGTLGVDQAALDNAELQLAYTRIVSPVDGVAGIRLVDPGNLLHTADTTGIVVLTKLDPIAVLFTVPQDELPRLAAALAEGPRKVIALSRGGDQVLGEGHLTVIDNQINVATGTVRLKAEFANPSHKLWPNQFVRARLEVTTQQDALTLPAAAVQHGPEGPYVYVLAAGDVAQQRSVSIGVLQGEEALIASGLKPGERVIVEGQDQIKPNAKVDPSGGTAPKAGRSGAHGAARSRP
jgi:multidrug efflux system membrane fusion protein